MTTTTATARPLSATIPPGVRMTEADGTPRLFFHVQTCEFLPIDELGYVPAELFDEIDQALLLRSTARALLAQQQVVIEAIATPVLAYLEQLVAAEHARWLALPRHSRVAATTTWRRAQRRRRRAARRAAAAARSQP